MSRVPGKDTVPEMVVRQLVRRMGYRAYVQTVLFRNVHVALCFPTDKVTVLDYWQAQEAVRRWAERNRLADVGMIRRCSYSVYDAVRDYLEEITVEKPARPVRAGAFASCQAPLIIDKGKRGHERWRTDQKGRESTH
jgi:hypothetical protein